jgi:hypothetical protein
VEYNHLPQHSSLVYLAPAVFAAQQDAPASPSCAPGGAAAFDHSARKGGMKTSRYWPDSQRLVPNTSLASGFASWLAEQHRMGASMAPPHRVECQTIHDRPWGSAQRDPRADQVSS